MKRVRIATVAIAAGLALTGCGSAAPSAEPDRSLASLVGDASPDAEFLLSTIDSGGLVQQDPGPSADPSAGRRKRGGGAARQALGHQVLHAEAVLAADNGTRTVDVQRGSVTAVSATSVTVRSTDGFTLEYRLTDKVKVLAGRQKGDLSAVTSGTEIGITGDRANGTVTAVLIIVAKK